MILSKIVIVLFITSITANILFAKTRILSDIDLPSSQIISLHYFDESHDVEYLKKLLKNGEIFSFLELYKHFDISIDYETDKEFYSYMSLFRMTNEDNDITLTIAVVFPSKDIGNYSKSISSSVLNYLIFNKNYFRMKVFDFVTQNPENLQKAIEKAKSEGYLSLILALTSRGIDDLKNINIPSDVNIFIPTININDLEGEHFFPNNIFFGGISYKNQIDKLIENINPKQNVVYNDNSQVGDNILKYLQTKDLNITASKIVSNKRTYYKDIIDLPQIDENTTIFLNTPIVTSSIILSNLTYNKKELRRILSTQINYNPSVFNLTQPQDIEKLYIANSIIDRHDRIEDINLLTNNNIIYNWVNYATVVGANFLINNAGYFTSYYDVPIANNQFIYNIEILSSSKNRFIKTTIEKDPIIEVYMDNNQSIDSNETTVQ